MAETAPRQTLCFTASFPPDGRLAATAGEVASRLAVSAGVGEAEAGAIGRSVESAFDRGLAEPHGDGATCIDVRLCAGQEVLDVSVACGEHALLTLDHRRP